MSATIPSNKRLDDLLKSTGFDCPENLKGKAFSEATAGGSGITIIELHTGNSYQVGSPIKLHSTYDKSLDSKCVVWFKKEQAYINTKDFVVGRTYKYTMQNTEGTTFDITIKKEASGSNYILEATFKDRGDISGGLSCFLVTGRLI